MSAASDPVGSVDTALKHALRLIDARPDLAAEQAQEILRAAPAQPLALLILGSAHRRQQAAAAALAVLDPLVRTHPQWGAAYYEQALALALAGRGDDALQALRQAVALEPNLTDAWRALADHLRASGDSGAAEAATARQIKAATHDPRLLEAAQALIENRIPSAEALLRKHLFKFPTDVAAIRMLAEVAARLRRYHDASLLLERALELAPGFSAARYNYAVVLHREARPSDALREVNRLLTEEPRNPGYRNLKAVVLGALGDYAESLEFYEELLAEYPNQSKAWISYGHALKTAGRTADCIAAYRRTLALAPTMGEAYWSLANLKTFRFEAADLTTIRSALERTDLSEEDRACFEFALGKALEDQADYPAAFAQYAAGNQRRKAQLGYEASEMTGLVARSRALLTPEFFAERAGFGAQAPDPIFIVGLPRAGSTLIEQILASHPEVEGTMELPDMIAIVRALTGAKGGPEETPYPDLLAHLSPERCLELGNQYLERTRPQRKSAAPFFIDKMPNNFAHLGLIQLLLPNARIIDARRHPLGCCFSAFKQYFARGQSFSYSLEDLGRYYHDYVELMAHYDAVLPGRVHRVIYETLVADTEAEVRSLLEFCGLPFDERCLKFYENERAVRTASSEQVRRPIYREGLDHWRHFEAYLEPLKTALGPVLECYPAVPEFSGRL
jgi:predicted Zn-dependent protease